MLGKALDGPWYDGGSWENELKFGISWDFLGRRGVPFPSMDHQTLLIASSGIFPLLLGADNIV